MSEWGGEEAHFRLHEEMYVESMSVDVSAAEGYNSK